MERVTVGRGRFLAAVLVVCGLALSGFALGSAGAADRTLTTNWIPEGTAAPVFHALNQGWFKEEGINLKIIRGYGSNKTAGEVAAGKTEFGYGDTAAIVLTRAKGGTTKAIGEFMTSSPVGVGALEPIRLSHPKDLEGKSIGLSAFTITRQLLPIMMAKNGADFSTMRIITVQPGVGHSQFLAGKFQVSDMWEASTKEISDIKAKARGKVLSFMPFRKFGLDIYSLTFWANEARLKNDAKVVRSFLKAAYRGFWATRKDRGAAYKSLMKAHPVLDKKVTRLQIDTLVESMIEWDRWEKDGAGNIKAAKMALTLETISKGFKVKAALKVQDLYTNDFLPGKM